MNDLKWWQTAVFYQIYPRSFADGNGDGIGDVQGMLAKLDYLQELGVDALWLSPHYPSPQIDCGYDISDYCAVAPEYGTLAEFETFLAEAHQRGLRVILDMVLNHTSAEHAWFLESKSSRDNPKRDWYIWRDPSPDGGPPNNWESTFTGSAWEYDETTGQYYYHYFLKEQPDLNWRNPEVKEALWDAVRFWLDMGIDGFRLDAIGTIYEDPTLPDQTSGMTLLELYQAYQEAEADGEREKVAFFGEVWQQIFEHQVGREEEMHPLMQELRTVIDEYPDRMLVAEDSDIAYYGDGGNEIHLVFNFPLMRTDRLTPAHIRQNQEERLSAIPDGAWPCNTLGNHDSSRVYTHFADGEHDAQLARLSLALMLTLRGTPFLYNGEEIGMTDLRLADLSQFRDTLATLQYDMLVEQGGMSPEQAFEQIVQLTRDKCRTPLHWDNAPQAGFSPADVETWLPANPNYADGVNVAEQLDDPDSLLSFYRRMLRLRKETPALMAGDYQPLHEEAEDYFAFLRRTGEQICLVVLNFSAHTHTLAFELEAERAQLIFSNRERASRVDDLTAVEIAQFEIYLAVLQ
ncbi:MAG: alpha-glucosidase [Chloroflexota bacterium]|nr:alpha-glucosidase [Chloroflexota bacterium]